MWDAVSVSIRFVSGTQCQLALGLLVGHSVISIRFVSGMQCQLALGWYVGNSVS